jgi:hypothetical protein
MLFCIRWKNVSPPKGQRRQNVLESVLKIVLKGVLESVLGKIYGNVCGSVCGSVYASVCGSVYASVFDNFVILSHKSVFLQQGHPRLWFRIIMSIIWEKCGFQKRAD